VNATWRIAITGATGLVGSALVDSFRADGHRVSRVVRRPPPPGTDDIHWDPATGAIHPEALEGFDAVVHLAGASISERWTEEHKRAIRDSRRQGTTLIARTIAALRRKPRVLVSASAVGYYGDGGDAVLDEASPAGGGFLGEVAQEWERAAEPAAQAGVRVVNTRFGLVLTPKGGILARLLTPFQLGVGGKVGSGQQWTSWIALDDLVAAVRFVLAADALRGPVNLTSPNPVTNEEFTHTLARVLHRPSLIPVPGFALRMVFGEMADELLLAGQRVVPRKLQAAGFQFRHPELEEALRFELARGGR
jgi:uncharacterized protein (TIGR01777 family)